MKFWNLRNDADMPEDGVLDIDGEIVAEPGWFTPDGACVAKEFRQALKGVRNVTVHINSPGGDVMAGAEIYSALREHSLNGEGDVTVIITALAASAASIVAMAGNRILMHPVAYMMIHNPWTVAMGDAKELRKTAKTLDVISEGLISAYQVRTGKDREELKKMLEAETWMSAGTCVEEGFADEIYGAGTGAAALCRMSGKAHGVEEIAGRIGENMPVGGMASGIPSGNAEAGGAFPEGISGSPAAIRGNAEAGGASPAGTSGSPAAGNGVPDGDLLGALETFHTNVKHYLDQEEAGKRAEIARRAEIAQRAMIAGNIYP